MSQNPAQPPDAGTEPDVNFCIYCGGKVIPRSTFCIFCGKMIKRLPAAPLSMPEQPSSLPPFGQVVVPSPPAQPSQLAPDSGTAPRPDKEKISVGEIRKNGDSKYAVIECPGCKTKISSSADKCYNCGSNLDKELGKNLVDEQRKAKMPEKKRKKLKAKKQDARTAIVPPPQESEKLAEKSDLAVPDSIPIALHQPLEQQIPAVASPPSRKVERKKE